ncbi:MAG: bifunctional oligoribonuclease/PAP phosphatase NrnA [Flavobacteriales bacterium]|nr:bifunctional oligoribonuclease/PAP phosphatase NrnA [Flavobacteriales bacterium]MCB9168305.1 bifunctional oligoribonuclease/PAP phosphatase NrnA [Flavobacteriales bacterium]
MSFIAPAHPSIATFRDLIGAPHRLAIIGHYNPDGDAMGSALGMGHALRAMGRTVDVLMPNTPPAFLQWMPGYPDVVCADRSRDRAEQLLREADVVLCLDFNRVDRVGPLAEQLSLVRCRVLIDHHQHPDIDVAVGFSDTGSSSTSQMVFDIIDALGQAGRIGPDAATCLYTGIMTDTGSFRFPATTPHTHRVAARLLEMGARPHEIHAAVMDENTMHRVKLLGFMLSERLTVHEDLGTAVIALSRQDLDRHHFHPGDTEGFVNYGLSIRGVRLSAFFMERGDRIKISLRSVGDLPVNELLAEHFDGGGHINAAGGQSLTDLRSTIDRFMQVLPTFLEAHPA